ncbi:MAG: extracellular solute-binding protein family 1 [Paenibacillus sp.]|nr:extracellular solute-binding protein family 1 [Paenibacillus sp.]
MINLRKAGMIVAILSISSIVAAGCGNNAKEEGTAPAPTKAATPEKPKDPVTLTMLGYKLSLSDEDFEKYIAKPVRDKYPHITMKLDWTDPVQLAATNVSADIFYTAYTRYSALVDLDIPSDMAALVKANNLDLNKYSKPMMDWIRGVGPKGEIYGLPFDFNHWGMFYNKDLFDKRGVAYPKDGLTWDDVLELNKKLTFQDGGVQYRGIIPVNLEGLSRVRSTVWVDPNTNKALVDTPSNKAIFELFRSFYKVPGMIVNNEYPAKGADFIKDGTVAMNVNWISDTAVAIAANKSSLNFDLASSPTYKDLPNTTIDGGPKMMGIFKTSKNKEDAFKVMQLLSTTEIQTAINRVGRLTALADENIRKDFGVDIPVLKGKNIQGALKVQPSKMAPPNPYTLTVLGKLGGAMTDLALDRKDINTIMREYQEIADKAIQDEMSAKKK